MATLSLKFSRLKRKEFREVLKKGKGFRVDFLASKILKNPNSKEVKIGVLVSKKVSKKAVLRNKLKRRIKEIVRSNKEKIIEGFKIVFIPLPGINFNFQDLKKKVEIILKKAKVLE